MSSAEMPRWVKASECFVASECFDGDWVEEVSAKGVDGEKQLEEARADQAVRQVAGPARHCVRQRGVASGRIHDACGHAR